MRLFSVFIWQKQTSKLMFGSYPHPGNLLECNTTEFIHVYVKPGKPPRFSPEVKAANRLTRAEHGDFVQQVWSMYPADVKRGGGHVGDVPMLFCGRGTYPSKDGLEVLSREEAGTAGKKAAAKHRRKTYGRG